MSVVIVTYQSADDLPACLDSLAGAAGPRALEVVVVDNASRDSSAEIARDFGAKVIENQANLGLSAAINQGVAATHEPWVLIVNPDGRLGRGAIARMVATGETDDRIACVGPRILSPDGSEYPTGRRFPSLVVGAAHAALGTVWPDNPWTRRYHNADMDRSAPGDVDWVSGSCMMVRRRSFDAVGGFDTGYFMYFEEMDFCLRLGRAGWRVVLEPGAEMVHLLGGSTRSAPYRKVVNHHRSALRFYCRRYAHDPRLALAPVVGALLMLRGGFSILRTALQQARDRRAAARLNANEER